MKRRAQVLSLVFVRSMLHFEPGRRQHSHTRTLRSRGPHYGSRMQDFKDARRIEETMRTSRRQFIRTAGISSMLFAAYRRGFSKLPALESASNPCFTPSGPEFAPFARGYLNQVVPGHDAFITEAYAAELGSIVTDLSKHLTRNVRDPKSMQAALAPVLTATLFRNPIITTLRRNVPLATEKVVYREAVTIGSASFIQSLYEYFQSFEAVDVAETQVSDIAISGSAPLELRTTINYQISGQINSRTREQRTGEWELRWRRTADNQWLITGWVAKHENRSRLMRSEERRVGKECRSR